MVICLNIYFIYLKRKIDIMENVMTNDFAELSENEMLELDGGAWYHVVGGVIGGIVGGVGGALGGAVAGGAVGTFTIPGIGNLCGASAGLVAGAYSGAAVADYIAQ